MRAPLRVRIARTARGEEGATAAVFLLSLFALLAVAMLAVDGNFLYTSQRTQVADTDAAALGAARALIENGCASQTTVNDRAQQVLWANDPTTFREGDVLVRRAGAGACSQRATVRVTSRRDSVSIFQGVFGNADPTTAVVSYAEIGAIPLVTGVRPVAICNQDPHYLEWKTVLDERRDGVDDDGDGTIFDNPTESDYASLRGRDDHFGVPPAPVSPGTPLDDHPTQIGWGVVHRLAYEQVGGSDCGGSPGNWGLIDFDEGGNGAPPIADWIRNGYAPGVDFGGPGDGDNDCNAADSDVDDCEAGPGATASLSAAFDSSPPKCSGPAADCEVIFFIVYDQIVDQNGAPTTNPPPGGATAHYNMVDLVGLVVRGVNMTGNPNGRYIDVEFIDRAYTGPIGDIPAGYTGPLGAALCGAGGFDNCDQ